MILKPLLEEGPLYQYFKSCIFMYLMKLLHIRCGATSKDMGKLYSLPINRVEMGLYGAQQLYPPAQLNLGNYNWDFKMLLYVQS